ncbi:MAG: hypothetical protein ABIZ80_03380, partial [Bryobacteraceae bacterium]
PAASFSCTYKAGRDHSLYLGTRKLQSGVYVGAQISITLDGDLLPSESLAIPEEDVLVRIPLGALAGNITHTITVTHGGSEGSYLYFDFLEIAIPTGELPVIAADSKVTLATDWDTDHSIALPAERTAWLMHSLGFTGRANHYMGALWFYELVRPGHSYAWGTVTFTGIPAFSVVTKVSVGISGLETTLEHLNLIGDTAASIAKAFELRLNNGFTAVWATATGNVLTIYSRVMGAAGNAFSFSASPTDTGGAFYATASGTLLSGGADGDWRTALDATPRINRAARDWSRSFLEALGSYGIACASAFSLELQHGDPSATAGIAQRYADGDAVQLNTPALQTNFSPTSLAYWRQVYLDMADIMSEAGQTPYLQFGEVQWWYFVWDSITTHTSLPLYDDYTTATFNASFGHAMHVFASSEEDPALYPDESQFLAGLIGAFTSDIIGYVRAAHSNAMFEVLYPPDVNDSPVNKVINLPTNDWSATSIDCLKTENFTFTGNRNLDQARDSILLPMQSGFPRSRASHLVGIGDYMTPWEKEVNMCKAEGVESIVLFALDQFCLIGYPAPLDPLSRRSSFQG